MKYKSIPCIIEATQFLDINNPPDGVKLNALNMHYVVTVQKQFVPISVGEWVITEADGIHHYPCADAVFRAKYELV